MITVQKLLEYLVIVEMIGLINVIYLFTMSFFEIQKSMIHIS